MSHHNVRLVPWEHLSIALVTCMPQSVMPGACAGSVRVTCSIMVMWSEDIASLRMDAMERTSEQLGRGHLTGNFLS
jgi:hypothetical protein